MNDQANYNQRQDLGQQSQQGWPLSEPKAAERPPAKPSAPVSFRMVGDMAPLFAAKAKARLDFKPIIRNRTVKVQPQNSPAYTFDYATLDSVRESCDAALATNGLDIFHVPCDAEDCRELHTILSHASGSFIECVIVLPATKRNREGQDIPLTVQETGSAMTYWERYSYVALAGVASEHDDDGNAADGNQVQNSQPRDRSRPAPPPKTTGQGGNGSPAQSSKASGKAPGKPQDAPPPQETPKVQTAPESPPQVKSEPPPAPTELLATADKIADMKSLFVALQFKGTPAKACINLLTGKDAATITNPDVETVCSVLQKALDSKWDAARVMHLIEEQAALGVPETAAVIAAIEEETAAMAGGS